jgi:hypothetical protein
MWQPQESGDHQLGKGGEREMMMMMKAKSLRW